MTTPTDKFSTASADQSAEAPFVLGKCNGHDLRGCPHGGGDAVWETNCNTWKGYHRVILCEKCADDLENGHSSNLPEKITTLSELISAREQRKAITCPNSPSFRGPIPAAFMANLSGEILHRLMAHGMWVYSQNDPISPAPPTTQVEHNVEHNENVQRTETPQTEGGGGVGGDSWIHDHAVIYISQQEPWWGTYNPRLPKGDDTNGNGTPESPFKTVERAMEEFKARGCTHGTVRDGSALIAFWPRSDNASYQPQARKT